MKLAVIPARGGSKRIPRKNVKPFAGKPMLTYAIGVAHESGLFDRIVVSTDDDEIKKIALHQQAEAPFLRPAYLADDVTPTVPVVAHAIRAILGEPAREDDLICCIYPGVPLLQAADLHLGLDCLLQRRTDGYAFPVVPFPSPIQRALRRAPDGQVTPLHPEYTTTRTQDLEPAYHDAGQFYWGRASAWLSGLDIHANGSSFVLPEWRVVDIDNPDDWLRAETIYTALQRRIAP